MLYIKEIINHKIGDNTPFKSLADKLGWAITLSENEVEQSDIDGHLYEKGFAPKKTDEQKAKEEAERIAMLNLTAADVERAIYKACGKDFEDIIAVIEQAKESGIDIKALKIELGANNFYRGNPYIDTVGTLLGFSKEMLDKFFDTNDYRYLTTCKLNVNAIPEEAVIEINSEIQSEITVPYGSTVDIVVSCEGYISRKDVLTLTEDRTLEVVLDEDTTGSDTTDVSDEVDTAADTAEEADADNAG